VLVFVENVIENSATSTNTGHEHELRSDRAAWNQSSRI